MKKNIIGILIGCIAGAIGFCLGCKYVIDNQIIFNAKQESGMYYSDIKGEIYEYWF